MHPFARVRRLAALGSSLAITSALAAPALAQDAPPVIDTGDTAWVLAASGARADDDAARARAVLRRPGAREEHAQRASCSASSRRASSACSGSWSATAWRSGGAGPFIGDSREVGLAGVDAGLGDRELRLAAAQHPRVHLRDVPGDVRDHHAGADPRRHRRAHEVLGVRGVHRDLAAGRLLPDRAHGLGRGRLDLQGRRDRLRRRARRAHVERLLGARRGAHARQAARASARSRCRRTACRSA